MTNLFEPVPLVKQFPWMMKVMNGLPMWVVRRYMPDMAMFVGTKVDVQRQVERVIAEYEEKGKEYEEKAKGDDEQEASRTIFETILASSLLAQEKTVDRLTDEAFVMVVAGGETTAKTLTNAVYHVLANAEWLKAVVEEIDQVMPDTKKLPLWSELERLPILTAVIKETLRVSAPVTNRVQVFDPEQVLMFDGWTIPPGTPLSMSIPAIHLDSRIYQDPYTFRPERFLGSPEEAKQASKYYMPFHRGFRSCLGMNLAYSELYLRLAAVFRRFELELVEVVRKRDVDTVRDCFVGMPSPEGKGVRVKIVRERT